MVWDKTASIRFRQPGRGRVHARIHVPAERVEEIRQQALREGVVEPTFRVEMLDDQDRVVAEVDKLLYIRWKDASK